MARDAERALAASALFDLRTDPRRSARSGEALRQIGRFPSHWRLTTHQGDFWTIFEILVDRHFAPRPYGTGLECSSANSPTRESGDYDNSETDLNVSDTARIIRLLDGHDSMESRVRLLWWAYPGLLDQKRQVVHPILLTYTARINDVREIIFAVGENEIGVLHSVVAVGWPRFCG